MTKHAFNSDYAGGFFPELLAALERHNGEELPGYGEDSYTYEAAEWIRTACHSTEAAVHFVVGGTQANLLAVGASLRPYQGVIAAETGHIASMETGAIEALGHKVLTLPSYEGKVRAEDVKKLYLNHWGQPGHEHHVQPGMLYISQPTELGTTYSRAELEALSQVCRNYGLIFYIDGARLLYSLCRPGNDLELEDYAHLSDIFSIGGTKAGLLFGEALVFGRPDLARHFRYLIKQRGALLSRGRLLGIQFLSLLRDGLYQEGCSQALRYASRLREAFCLAGQELLPGGDCNLIFVRMAEGEMRQLARGFIFEQVSREADGRYLLRFCTSTATREEAVEALEKALGDLAAESLSGEVSGEPV